MGSVWLAEDMRLGRRVALKVLEAPQESSELEARLLREARVLAHLEHPGIVPVHDAGTLPDGRVFYAMKYVQGRQLDQHLADVPSRPDRLRIFQRICEAVAFAHARGVLHRDLKPENIMVGPFGEVLVMDWGLAKVLRERGAGDPAKVRDGSPQGHVDAAVAPRTGHGQVLGTPGYMAPEQARGEVDRLAERTDVYALGGILCFLLTGRLPEDTLASGKTAGALDGKVSGIPRPLSAICAKAMSYEPEERYAGAEQLAEEVSRYLDGLPVKAYPESLFGRMERLFQKHSTAVLLILTYLLVRALLIFFGRR